ncbi:DUF445 domain-containing protein [Corticibacter populi]|uniref:DUF445 domain-containing protein n=1 Tax=Corticibacter populi TaxID=1550736 RepID=A0A3M6QPG9_9BURK|nr:DUF445 domain-containing protein [Corticibacter populi]RMX04915.1 DUF445 domain-containing protein [Corticibacter populi]RZS33660.1 uncharacterized membrane-anchored protein YjiN (DUF445 family) [Corticibacter populi]
MKHLALLLLLAAALLYIVATALAGRHPAWPYVAAFAEAGMVGALADWFAVVALFRHPLGLPIPHTAVIANNQQRIGRGLADFLDQNFLGAALVRERLAGWDAAAWLAGWLCKPQNVRTLTQPLLASAEFGLRALDEAHVRQFVTSNIRTALRQLDVSASAAAMLDALTAEQRHQVLLDDVLRQLAGLLQGEAVQQQISEAIARELRALRYLALDKAAARLTTRKIVAAVARNLAEMGESPGHPLRQRFDEAVHQWILQLKADPAVREKANQLRDQLLDHPALGDYLNTVWNDLLAWLADDLRQPGSGVRQRLEAAAAHLGGQLQASAPMRDWLNRQVREIVPQVLERYRPAIRRYVAERVGQWDTRELVREVETHLGRDLQYIRINGTLVGGLVGLVIHSVTQWFVG